jgi:hypothetical protein
MAFLSACGALPPVASNDAGPVAPVPITDVVQPKLAPSPSLDPTLAQPLVERRCDFSADLVIDPSWFSREQLSPDGQIALARTALGPSALCQKVELVNITVIDDGSAAVALAQVVNERRAEGIRRFFISRGVNPDTIVATSQHPSSQEACTVTSQKCLAHVLFQIRGVAR